LVYDRVNKELNATEIWVNVIITNKVDN